LDEAMGKRAEVPRGFTWMGNLREGYDGWFDTIASLQKFSRK